MIARTAQFEQQRGRLLKIAYRLLGSVAEAEDVVQEAFIRWCAVSEVESPRKLLATIVTRLCLDILKSARVQRQRYVGQWLPELYVDDATPDRGSELSDNLSFGFMTMLERLTPEQRAVFVLRVAFDLEYADIAEVMGSSEANCRQLVKRARDRITGPVRYDADAEMSHELARCFARACNNRSHSQLMDLLATDCRLISDGGGHLSTARRPILGPDKVGRLLVALRSKYHATLRALEVRAGASPLLGYELQAQLRGVATLDIAGTPQPRIAAVYLQWNPDKLRHLTDFAR